MTAAAIPARSVGLTPEQLEARKRGIGGSEAAAVLNVDPYKTALQIYELKLGLREPEPANAAMKRGIFLEPIARKLYRELTGRKARRLGQRVHPSYPFMMCNVDGQILGDQRGPGVLELKCPGVWMFAKIKREGLPLQYVVQMQHNLAVTGYAWGSFALFNADLWELIHFDVLPDLELQHALVIKEQQFWLQHIEARVPPPAQPDTTPEIAAQLARAQGAVGGGELIVRSDAEWVEGARMYLEAKEIEETAENLKESATEKLKALMVQPGAVEGGGIRCYWSEREGRITFDKKALAAAQPLDRVKVLAALAAATEKRGLQSADALFIADSVKGATLDLSAFDKHGKPYQDFRTYVVKIGVGD